MASKRPACRHTPAVRDSIDRVLAGWRHTRADLDVAPIAVFARLNRLRPLIDQPSEAIFRQFGLNGPSFAVLATLTRLGPPHRISQRQLMNELNLTSGTISVRVDRLVSAGLVSRESDPEDRRGAIVALTGQGAEVFDACAPLHLANEQRLLAALSDEDQQLLADLLRELLASLERPAGEHDATHWGMTLAPAHVALQMRRDVGLPERPGLLVRAIDAASPAAAAGIRRGDLLVAANGEPLRSLIDLYDATQPDGTRTIGLGLVRGMRDRKVVLSL